MSMEECYRLEMTVSTKYSHCSYSNVLCDHSMIISMINSIILTDCIQDGFEPGKKFTGPTIILSLGICMAMFLVSSYTKLKIGLH